MIKFADHKISMKKLIAIIISFIMNCISFHITQAPSLPQSQQLQVNEEQKYSNRSVNQEEEFFNEVSKQDPYLTENICKECKPDHKPPGYIPENESQSIVVNNESKPEREEVVIITQTENQKKHELIGIASWYGKDFDGRKTASGEIFSSRGLTAAHRTLPLGTRILVINQENNKEVILKVNDRGPFVKNRVLDVSEYAAEILDFKHKGLAKVEIKILKEGSEKEINEGATEFFYKSLNSKVLGHGSDASLYEKMIHQKKQKILSEIKDIQSFKYYSVQIGSFTEIANIIRIKEELESKIKYPVYILRNNTDYVIRVGNFLTREEAESLRGKLSEDGYKGFVTNPS